MTVADVVILNIARIIDRTGDLKDTNKSIGFIIAFVHYQLSLDRLRCAENEFYVDSTPGTVCENRYISSLKVARGFASRGKSTKGWFFGFKLHGGGHLRRNTDETPHSSAQGAWLECSATFSTAFRHFCSTSLTMQSNGFCRAVLSLKKLEF